MRWLLVPLIVSFAASPSPSPSPAARLDEEALPASYKRVLTALRERKEDAPLAAPLRFGRRDRPAASQAPAGDGRASLAVVVRSVKQIEGEWAAFLDEDRRPSYPGQVVRGWKIVTVEESGVTFQLGDERKKVAAKPVRPPFPELVFNGMVDMPTGRVVLMKDRRDPVKVGDVVSGARIVDIQPGKVLVEHYGERRSLPVK